VAYYDNQKTQFYAPGEGQGNVLIDATNLATGATASTTTWDSGGYEIALAPGQYQITASVNGTVVQTTTMTIGTQNVEQDFILSNTWDGRSRDQVLSSVAPTASQENGSWSSVAPVSAPSQPSTPPQNTAPVAVAVAVPSQGITAAAPLTVNYDPSAASDWTSWKAQMS
jgi:hypothetical protein